MSLPIRLRNLIPDDLAGSDIFDDAVASVKSNYANREPSPQQETKTRRDDSATDKFLKALLNSHDLTRRITADDVLGLAKLATRALDDLD